VSIFESLNSLDVPAQLATDDPPLPATYLDMFQSENLDKPKWTPVSSRTFSGVVR